MVINTIKNLMSGDGTFSDGDFFQILSNLSLDHNNSEHKNDIEMILNLYKNLADNNDFLLDFIDEKFKIICLEFDCKKK